VEVVVVVEEEEEEKCRGACGGSGWEQWLEAALKERSAASGEERRCDEGSDDIKRQKGRAGWGIVELREEDDEGGDTKSAGRGRGCCMRTPRRRACGGRMFYDGQSLAQGRVLEYRNTYAARGGQVEAQRCSTSLVVRGGGGLLGDLKSA
jgi:hypothetical protein